MKKVLILLAVTALSGCTIEYTAVINQSSFPVSFSYIDDTYTLNPGESAEIKFYNRRTVRLHTTKKVYLDNAVFRDCPSYSLKVINNLGAGITAALSADGWMDPEPEAVAAGENNTAHSSKVYTSTPAFTVTASNGFPAQAAYNIDGTDIKVILRW